MNITARFEFKLADLWIGVFWRKYRAYMEDDRPRQYQDTGNPYDFLDVWICLVPCVPLHVRIERAVVERAVRG